MQIVKLKFSELQPNTGQIPGLPINPRQWTKSDVDKIAASLKETPELFEARPLLVIPHDGKYVILGGNLRYEGARVNKMQEVPAIIFPEDTPVDKMKEVVIKDNGAFGAWDYDELGNNWSDLPLTDWGIPAWEQEDEEIPTDLDATEEEKPYVLKVTFPDAESMTSFVMAYKDILENDYGCTMSETGGAL